MLSAQLRCTGCNPPPTSGCLTCSCPLSLPSYACPFISSTSQESVACSRTPSSAGDASDGASSEESPSPKSHATQLMNLERIRREADAEQLDEGEGDALGQAMAGCSLAAVGRRSQHHQSSAGGAAPLANGGEVHLLLDRGEGQGGGGVSAGGAATAAAVAAAAAAPAAAGAAAASNSSGLAPIMVNADDGDAHEGSADSGTPLRHSAGVEVGRSYASVAAAGTEREAAAAGAAGAGGSMGSFDEDDEDREFCVNCQQAEENKLSFQLRFTEPEGGSAGWPQGAHALGGELASS